MNYTDYFKVEDIAKRGYNLTKEGNLNQGDFSSISEAADEFCQECFDKIYNAIEENRGSEYTANFFIDMSTEFDKNVYPKAALKKESLKWALIEQVIFIYENGDADASAKKNNDMLGLSPKAIQKLYNAHILIQ